ncbi:LysR family transcriptional regulator [Affinibrenneria salicis]|uniref:LysR family transcriptional regulator n=1 Tax=Affinibrenneria salicis TaxID=2590031 RepID=A0A5J5FVS1_9GAMM|nr:LysR family transcriptional regulator [Affinibrenneria salicis]KAA8997661.1 LysR family transcriptional regulator [Affinibrenneria salicis]
MSFEKSKTIEWGDVPVFLTLARLGTLTATAQRLKMAPSSVSRHIEHLEQDLGVALFQRSPQGYVLTESAQSIIKHAEVAESAIDDFIRQSSGFAQDVAGTVRIALPENFATQLVIPALPVFQTQYPDLRIEIVSNVRMANLTRREADIAIRLLRPNYGNFVASRIGQMESGLYASSDYLATHPADLVERGTGHMCIGWDDTLLDFPLARWLEQIVPAGKTNFTASSLQSQIEAAVAGLGLVALPSFLAGNLVRFGQERLLQDIYLISHSDIRWVPRIDVTMTFLHNLFRDAGKKLAGAT